MLFTTMQNFSVIRNVVKICCYGNKSTSRKTLSTIVNCQHAINQQSLHANNYYDEGGASIVKDRFIDMINPTHPSTCNYFACHPDSRVMSPKPMSITQSNSFDDEEYDQSINFASPHQAAMYFDGKHQ